MQDSKWPEATAIVAMAAALTFILTPWERVGPINWEALSAVGTLLAVVVALWLPARQNRQRQREQNEIALMRAWTAAHIASQIAERINVLLIDWAASGQPSSSEFSGLLARLNTLQDRVDSVVGANIVTSLASLAGAIEGCIKKAEQGALIQATKGSTRGSGVTVLPDRTNDQFEEFLNSAMRLKSRCENWMSQVLNDAEMKEVVIPGVVRGSGTAEAAFTAEGSGHVKRPGYDF